MARAAEHPRSALDELQFLKRVLREAQDRGQRVDEAVLRIRHRNHAPRRGRALTVAQLYELASWFPDAAAGRHDRESSDGRPSVFDGFTSHWLRHTADSLMAVAGYDPAVAAERMGHTDGGALFLRTYRHLYEGEKRVHAARLDAFVRRSLDKEGTSIPGRAEDWHNQADSEDGRTWDRTRDLSRVKRALSR